MTACSASPDDVRPDAGPTRLSTAAASAGQQPPPGDGQDIDFVTPLKKYMLTTTENATISYARSRLIAECANRFGFTYPTPPFSTILTEQKASEEAAMGRLYGPTDRDAVRRWGYLPDPSASEEILRLEQEVAAQDNVELILTGEQDGVAVTSPASLDGTEVPPGGCIGEADRRLGLWDTSDGQSPDWARSLLANSSKAEQGLPAYQEVVADWAECMAAQGYGEITSPINDPATARLISSRPEAATPTEEEVTMLLVDIDCKQQTQLVERLNTVTGAYEEDLIEQNVLELQESRDHLDQVVRKATEEAEKAGGFK